ncbi:MAG TPA: AGE family epimerase/isomerase [Caulobacteraceae bacterium]
MSAPAPVREALARLEGWLTGTALPLWARHGADETGFHGALTDDLSPAGVPQRVRVQARQAFVFALAAEREWLPEAESLARHALAALTALKGDDGLYRRPGAPPATGFDGMGELYEQAFALLGFASGYRAFGHAAWREAAEALRTRIAAFAHPLGGYAEASGLAAPLFANPNMHLFEAFMAWAGATGDTTWLTLADAQAVLAHERLTPASGLVLEQYAAGWASPAAPVLWPGHLFEWGSLLLQHDSAKHRDLALHQMDIAERAGVEADLTLFALDGELMPTDRGARLWSQTERLRATAMAAALTGEAHWWDATLSACRAVEAFLAPATPGLWRDWRDEAGAFLDAPAPATSLYHIVGAIDALAQAVAA